MTPPSEKENWTHLIHILEVVADHLSDPKGCLDPEGTMLKSLQFIKSFYHTAATHGLRDFAETGMVMERYLADREEKTGNFQRIYTLTGAVCMLLKAMRNVTRGDFMVSDPTAHVRKILASSTNKATTASALHNADSSDRPGYADSHCCECGLSVGCTSTPPSNKSELDLRRLTELVAQLGGEVTLIPSTNGSGNSSFQLKFQTIPDTLEHIEALLSPCDLQSVFAPLVTQDDARIERVLNAIRGFLAALSMGDLSHAQGILRPLIENLPTEGLFVEIGMLARGLHNSLKNFMRPIDPVLHDLVVDTLPDSGNRLEHIMELTETAASTTLDHVEAMQKRNKRDQKDLNTLHGLFADLMATGSATEERLRESQEVMQRLINSAIQTEVDLTTVLTAQGYQDLAGQIIMKIMTLLNDLQLKLVKLIRTFGVPLEERKKATEEERQGPVDRGKVEALHTQDDVDSLLAEFGF